MSVFRPLRGAAQRLSSVSPISVRTPTTTVCSVSLSRPLSSSTRMLGGGADSHGSKYDPPSGWLFGVKPGEKPEREGWEWPWYIGIYGTLIFTAVIYVFKPDTSIQTWALEEARRRLEAEGILEDPYPDLKLVDPKPVVKPGQKSSE